MSSIWNQTLGFAVIVFGVYALNVTKEADPGCRNGVRALFGFTDRWRRPQHELGERSRLLANEESSDNDQGHDGVKSGDAVKSGDVDVKSGVSERRGIVDSRRRTPSLES